jgi:AraC family transcriptional regulator of adaptative response / DNA-3-methyladenine glycosylase II
LFDKHLGASPGQIARTARVQRAKRLLDDTQLPMIEIALRAGFRSLRRFNAVFAEVYKRPPTEIRRAQRSGWKLQDQKLTRADWARGDIAPR